jgi:hypothetical protein
MATAAPVKTFNREETQERVRHPLERLRGTIRFYVTAHGLATVALYLALWFWIGLAIDYGFFRLFGVDWVQVFPRDVRAVVLGALVAGLLVLVIGRVLRRLFREFRPQALALVLERRFPEELGDRLITAVELADPRLAQRYGYSQPMVDHTVQDAATRVGRLPVGQVFDWRRLRRAWLWVAVLTLGLFALVASVTAAVQRQGALDSVLRFTNIAAIWFERNILLADTIWPRRAHLELVDFPDGGDLHIGRDSPPPLLHVRAIKWLVADVKAPEGWRAMQWHDLTPELLGSEAIPHALPAGWETWSLDRVETELDRPEAHATLDADTWLALRDVFAQLHARAASPRLARRFRELTIPDAVVVYYQGQTVRSEQTLKKQADNEYSGTLSDLKESVRFTANGEDYYTPYKRITIVPPPSLVELTRDEEQPAYLYHRATPDRLRGKKQLFHDQPVSLSGSASHIDVPAGTNVVLRGRTDKALRLVDGVRLRPREGGAPVKAPIQALGPQAFEVRFQSLTAPVDFIFELTDTDNVVGLRPLSIRPIEDTAPEVDVQVEYVRKTNQGYLITPSAMLPFSGKVRDDHGLETVEFTYTLVGVESQALTTIGAIVSALQGSAQGPVADFLWAANLAWIGTVARSAGDETVRPPLHVPVDGFARRLEDVPAEDATTDWKQRLSARPETPLLRDYSLDPDDRDAVFDVEKLGLKVSDERQTQPHYKMRLWVTARDNNVETGPGIGESKEKFPVLIVSENELLLEVAREEEGLHLKLEETVNKLKDGRYKLQQVAQELPGLKPDEFSPMARRVEEILDTLTKGWDVTGEVSKDYQKILKELRTNRVRPQIIDRIERTICDPLQDVIAQDREFEHAERALRAFHDLLEAKKPDMPGATLARDELDRLIDRLSRVLDAMGDITTINKLIEQLVKIEQAERKAYDRFKELSDKLQEDLLDKALNQPPGAEEKK